jgi:hypothetical protein
MTSSPRLEVGLLATALVNAKKVTMYHHREVVVFPAVKSKVATLEFLAVDSGRYPAHF